MTSDVLIQDGGRQTLMTPLLLKELKLETVYLQLGL